MTLCQVYGKSAQEALEALNTSEHMKYRRELNRLNLIREPPFEPRDQETLDLIEQLYPALLEREVHTLKKFLASFWSYEDGDWVDFFRIEPMPTEIKAAIDLARVRELFDDFEIWSTYNQQLCLGVIYDYDGKTFYKIDRWGTSLPDYGDMCEIVAGRELHAAIEEADAAEDKVFDIEEDQPEPTHSHWFLKLLVVFLLIAGIAIVAMVATHHSHPVATEREIVRWFLNRTS